MSLDLLLFLKGVGVGILFSMPVGAVNIMAIQRTFRRGFWAGVFTGLGAVAADGLFAALAAYGFTAVADLIQGHSRLVQLVGSVLLIVFGLRIWFAHPHIEKPRAPAEKLQDPVRRHLAAAGAAFGLTITNPGTVIGFIAVFGTLRDLAPEPGDFVGATLLFLGVLTGLVAWWFFVSGLVSWFRRSINDHTLERINHFAGGALILLGIVVLARLVWLSLA